MYIEGKIFQRLNYFLHSQSKRGLIFEAKGAEGVSTKRCQYVYLEISVLDSELEEAPQNDVDGFVLFLTKCENIYLVRFPKSEVKLDLQPKKEDDNYFFGEETMIS